MPNGGDGFRTVGDALSANYSRLTQGQRRVIDRLLADTRYAAVISAPELAQAVGVSESTVTRAAQALGFAGYPDLQARLREQFFSPLPKRVEANLQDLEDTPEAVAIKAILEDAESVRLTAEDLPPETLRVVVETLIGARRVMIFGSRGSYGLAHMLAMGLRLLLDDVRIINQAAGDLADQLMTLNSDDAVVAISFRRVQRATVNVVQHASRVGTKTIAITDVLHNPVSRMADHTLIARLGPLRLMPSYAAGASLVNALTTAVSMKTLDSASDRLQAVERLWDDFNTLNEN